MHTPSLLALLIVLGLAFLLFGKPGRLSSAMEDLGKGIKGFRKGLTDTDTPAPPAKPEEPPKQIVDRSGTTTGEGTATGEKNGA